MQDRIISKTDAPPEEIARVKKECYEVLCALRQKLLIHHPFIGGIAMKMNIVPVRDERLCTAATDDNNIYFDVDFFSRLEEGEQLFVLAHEIWHVVMMHLLRNQSRDPQIFNIATDKEVNYIISQDGGAMRPPPDVLFPTDKERGLSAEEIYELLIKNMKKQAKNAAKNGQNGKGQQGQGQGQGQKSGKSSGQGDGDDDSQSGKNSDPNAGGKKGKLSGQFDKHIYGNNRQEEESQNGQNGNGEGGQGGDEVRDRWGKKGQDPDYNPAISKDAADRIRERVISEAMRVQRTRGTLPSSIEQLIAAYQKPEVDWKAMLCRFVTKCFNTGNRVWCPPNRRHVYNDLYLQSRRSERIKVCACVDTSGSCTYDLSKFLSELNSLVKSFGKYELTIAQCDADIHAWEVYNEENPFPEDRPQDFKFKGFGGSDSVPFFEEFQKRNCDCDCVLYFTDGYLGVPTTNTTGKPFMWILTKDGANEDFCSFGEKMYFTIPPEGDQDGF